MKYIIKISHLPPRQTLCFCVCGPTFSDVICSQASLVSQEAVEGVKLGIAEEGGYALVAQLGSGEELGNGTKTVLAQEVIMIDAGKEMHCGAEVTSGYI